MKSSNTGDFEIKTRVLSAEYIADSIIRIAEKADLDGIVIGNIGRSVISEVRTIDSVSRA